MLYSVVDNPIVSSRKLNENLERIRQWAFTLKLEFKISVTYFDPISPSEAKENMVA